MNIFTIPPNEDFLPAIARTLLDSERLQAAWPEVADVALAQWTIFVPTRRARRFLEEAFLAQNEMSPLLLPRLFALGDSDEASLGFSDLSEEMLALPPAISARQRHFYFLARVLELADTMALPQPQAASLANELAHLLDDSLHHNVALTQLDGLVSDDLAAHWQKSLDVLQLIREDWPRYLESQQRTDEVTRRNALLRLQARHWQASDAPVLLAGTTASQPAVQNFARALTQRPRAGIILPALDEGLQDEREREAALAQPQHPQHILAQLLDSLDCAPAKVQLWAGAAKPNARTRLAASLFASTPAKLEAKDFADLAVIEAASPRAEAGIIACLMREVLETPAKTAALVTPDRRLARAVAAELGRWGLRVDDSGGQSLADAPLGHLLLLLLEAAASDYPQVALLALLRSPLVRLGQARAEHQAAVQKLERYAWRLNERDAAQAKPHEDTIRALQSRLRDALAPLQLLKHNTAATDAILQALRATLEALLGDDASTGASSGATRLLQQADGDALLEFFTEIELAAPTLPQLACRSLPHLMRTWLKATPWRAPQARAHERLFIWGSLEARLLSADRIILGGLNEGVWPRYAETGPWLSRPMRKQIGLPPPERAIGQAAHDFASLLGAPGEVICTRAKKQDGVPRLASRWLARLAQAAQAAGAKRQGEAWAAHPASEHWAALERAPAAKPVAQPAPKPPAAARPRSLSVTQIETLASDPYAIYAREVLDLKPLDELETPLDARHSGSFLHSVMERFHQRYLQEMQPLPKQFADKFLAEAQACAREVQGGEGIFKFWRARLHVVAQRIERDEHARRARGLVQTVAECKGAWEFFLTTETKNKKDDARFRLRCRADRIDVFADGSAEIIDYKSSGLPEPSALRNMLKPQLPLEALILRAGGFDGLGAHEANRLTYIRLAGDARATMQAMPIATAMLDDYDAWLRELLERYTRAPYVSHLEPQRIAYASDYDHLARVAEWGAAEPPAEATP